MDEKSAEFGLVTWFNGKESLPMVRPEGVPTPCGACPRGGPENEERLRLSLANVLAYDFYKRAKATPGFVIPDAINDATLQNNFVTIETLLRNQQIGEMGGMMALMRPM